MTPDATDGLDGARAVDIARSTLRDMPIMPIATLGLLVAGGLFVDWTLAAVWSGAMLVSTLLLRQACLRVLRTPESVAPSAVRHLALACFAQAFVTAGYAVLLWHPGHGEWNLALVMITMANTVFAASLNAPLRRIYAPIIVLYAVTVSALCAWEAGELLLTFSILMPIFFGIVAAAARRAEMRFTALLVLGRERDDLIEDLQAANRAKNDFLSNMSHELRTPLNAILGFSEVIKDEVMGPIGNTAYRAYASDIHGSGRHLLGLVNDVLDLAQIEAGGMKPMDEAVTLADLVEQTVSELAHEMRPLAISVRAEVPPGLQVRADPHMMRRIVGHLLINATSGADRSDVVLNAGATADGVTLTVAGDGLRAMLDRGNVFEAFSGERHDIADRRKTASLRLAIVKGLTGLHEGSVNVLSADVPPAISVTLPASRIVKPGDARAAA